MNLPSPRHVRVAIIGTGFGGLGLAIRLRQTGRDDFLLFERADDVGGVWRDNSYPGCACDVQSHLYSFSFAPNPDWSHAYSRQAEIWAYLRDCADRFGIGPHIRFGHEVRGTTWDEDAQRWRIETSRGDYTADVLVAAVGALSEPAIPTLAGLEDFGGATFHSARWDHGYDLAGKRVAVIGTGASAIQFVPEIQPRVARLHLFQRTPPWILPRHDAPIDEQERRRYRRSTLRHRLERARLYVGRELLGTAFLHPRLAVLAEKLALRHLAAQVPDPELRRRLTPTYRIGCKRILVSDDYLPAVSQPNVELVTDPIARVTAAGIATADGRERPVDAIVFGTGFHVSDPPFAGVVRGRGGRTLAEVWGGSPRAHLGLAMSGFPNLFWLLGPNTGTGHTSVIVMMEAQIEHVLGALAHLERHDLATCEPSPEAQAAFLAYVDERMRTTVWKTGGCDSWYLDRTGRNSALWPGYTFSFMRRARRFDPAEYRCERRRARRAHEVAA